MWYYSLYRGCNLCRLNCKPSHSSEPNYNRGLATSYHSACNAVVTGTQQLYFNKIWDNNEGDWLAKVIAKSARRVGKAPFFDYELQPPAKLSGLEARRRRGRSMHQARYLKSPEWKILSKICMGVMTKKTTTMILSNCREHNAAHRALIPRILIVTRTRQFTRRFLLATS